MCPIKLGAKRRVGAQEIKMSWRVEREVWIKK